MSGDRPLSCHWEFEGSAELSSVSSSVQSPPPSSFIPSTGAADAAAVCTDARVDRMVSDVNENSPEADNTSSGQMSETLNLIYE